MAIEASADLKTGFVVCCVKSEALTTSFRRTVDSSAAADPPYPAFP